jgi:uncharacterized membrane protein
MVMLLQIVAAVLLLLGSGIVFYALLALDGRPQAVARGEARPVPPDHELPRAA